MSMGRKFWSGFPYMKLEQLRNELQGARNCGCTACLRAVPLILSRIEDKEAVQPAAQPDEGYDPVFLLAGIKAPKLSASARRTMARRAWYAAHPQARIEAGRIFSEVMKFSRTVEGIAREQKKLDRVFSVSRGHVYQG